MKQTAPLSKSQYGIYVECMNHVGEIYYPKIRKQSQWQSQLQ